MMNTERWSMWAIHELPNFPADGEFPTGICFEPAPEVVNSDGVATDTTARDNLDNALCIFGGGLKTTRTKTAEEQAEQFGTICDAFPGIKSNHRSRTVLHIRVPGLRRNLARMQQAQQWIRNASYYLFDLVSPFPEFNTAEFTTLGDFVLAETFREEWLPMTQGRICPRDLREQLTMPTAETFLSFPCMFDGYRVGIDLSPLPSIDAVVFNNFPSAESPRQVQALFEFATATLVAAFEDTEPTALGAKTAKWSFPDRQDFSPTLERRFLNTSHSRVGGGEHSDRIITDNIKAIYTRGETFR